MPLQPSPAPRQAPRPDWRRELARFEKPDTRKAVWQLVDTFVPYVALWAAMVVMLRQGLSYWLVLPLVVVASGFLVRIFIFFHDCCHDCFLPTRRANRLVGYITGVLTFTPFDDWRHQHALHHAGSGNLERRGAGDIWTLTVAEYRSAPGIRRLGYRLFRNPLVLFLLGPFYMFFVAQRFWHRESGERGRRSVAVTNAALLGLVAAASLTIGLKTYLLIQIPVMAVAGMFGIWLFYVQHQYDPTYWEHQSGWDPVQASLEGSSYYKLPKVLQWFSGNIGLHHIHHLRARIPNYHLQACYDSVAELQAVEPLTLLGSLRCLFLNLWDEGERRMVSFRALRRRSSAA
ncbi:MAG: fatty acid desaturase [Chthonomonadales bacterium]|nr:fatty acid desaturase [Chthonomonadales bacterium]